MDSNPIVDLVPNRDMKLHIEDIRNLEIRDDDIYLATYPKYGTHWVWEILVMLSRGNAEYETKTKEAVFLDYGSPEKDPVREIKKINRFLDMSRSDDLIKRIAEACDFKNLKKADEKIKVRPDSMKNIQMPNMYRKGKKPKYMYS